jgi:phosphatidyl-myo-inositol dimannoside synthase
MKDNRRVLVLHPGLFDKGGISRFGRFFTTALREGLGENNVRALSLAGYVPGDIESPFSVHWAGPFPVSNASRVYFSSVAFQALAWRPTHVATGLLNFGPLGYFLARMANARFVQLIYGREIWSPMKRIRRMALQRSDAVIADSQNSADQAYGLGLVPYTPRVIWDCVDITRYSPKEPAWDRLERYGIRKAHRFTLLFVGRINRDTQYKGFNRLVDLMETLPPDKFQAVIAGTGNYLTELRARVADKGLTERVLVTGPIHEADLVDLYRCADVFYLPSEAGDGMGEGIPLTPMEAMSCGVPVIVGNQDGSRELISNRGGWCGDPLDLAHQRQYIERVMGDPSFHADEKATARTLAVDKFGYDAFRRKILDVFE